MVPSEVVGLVIVFGAGASTCGERSAETSPSADSPRSPSPPSWAGTTPGAADPAGRISTVLLSGLFSASLKAGEVGPAAMQDDGDLAGNGDLGLHCTDVLHQPRAPYLQGRPALGSMQTKLRKGALAEDLARQDCLVRRSRQGNLPTRPVRPPQGATWSAQGPHCGCRRHPNVRLLDAPARRRLCRPGPDHFERADRTRLAARLARKRGKLGFDVALSPRQAT